MDQPPPDDRPAAALPWKAELRAAGPSSLAARRWPVQLHLTNVDQQPHGIELVSILQVRLRHQEQGLSLTTEASPPPGPWLSVQPGAELQLPFDLFDHVHGSGRLTPGQIRIALRIRTAQQALPVPPVTLRLDP